MDYRVTLYCRSEFELDDTVWDFERGRDWPAGQGFWIFEEVGEPHRVRGIIRLSSPIAGIFAPDNGPEMPIHYARDGQPGGACL